MFSLDRSLSHQSWVGFTTAVQTRSCQCGTATVVAWAGHLRALLLVNLSPSLLNCGWLHGMDGGVGRDK